MTDKTIVHVMRHGEVHNPDKILYGRKPDFHLSDRGRAQAEAVAGWLAERDIVYARAKGELDSHPFGTELDVYSDEYEWMSHSMAPTPHADRAQRVKVGSTQCSQPYDAALLNISAMSLGSLGANAIEALNRGAKLGGFYHDTGEGGFSPYHRIHGGDIVWELGSGYFGCRDDNGSARAAATHCLTPRCRRFPNPAYAPPRP